MRVVVDCIMTCICVLKHRHADNRNNTASHNTARALYARELSVSWTADGLAEV